MPVPPAFDKVKFLVPVRAAMHGWASANEAGLWDRIRATDAAIREMQAKKRFTFGNATHLKALRDLNALCARTSDFAFRQMDADDAIADGHCCALEEGWDYVTHHSGGTVVQYAVRRIEDGIVSIRFEDGTLSGFALGSPLHSASLPIAA